MRMFDGSNFVAWWECMRDALTQQGLHGPLNGIVGRPSSMLSKIYFDIIYNLKYDFISLELIILERESTMETK